MNFLDKIQSFIYSLDNKKFIRYSIILLGMLFVTTIGFLWYYSRSVQSLKNSLEEINDYREQAQTLLRRSQEVRQERKRVSHILSEEENFKITEFFEKLLNQLNLSNKRVSIEVTTQTDTQGTYDEAILTAKLTDMSMKDLTELLQSLEKNQRIFTKELEINRAKNGRSLDITLQIATLLPKETGGTP